MLSLGDMDYQEACGRQPGWKRSDQYSECDPIRAQLSALKAMNPPMSSLAVRTVWTHFLEYVHQKYQTCVETFNEDHSRRRLRRRVPKISKGEEADYGEWPWQISLRVNEGGYGGFVHPCGAVLLSSVWAVTAAHCTER